MEKNKSLQKSSNNIFNKVYNFFKILFYNKKKERISESVKTNIQTTKDKKEKNDFIKSIEINDKKDRIISLKQKFDNRMIDVKEITMKDKIELLELYKKEILENKNILKRLGRL